MKNKIIISILAIFIIGCGLATVYAEDAHIGSFDFDVPDGFTIKESNSSQVVLQGNNKEIIVTTECTDQPSITKYMDDKGFKYTTSGSGNVTTYDRDGSQQNGYSYTSYSFTKGSESANAFVVNKKGVTFTVIVIDHSGSNSNSFIMDSDVSSIIRDIMDDD